MKILFIIASCLFLAVFALFFILGMITKQGQAIGLVDDVLSNCPDKPNCVCSEDMNDIEHYVTPLLIEGNSVDSLTLLKACIAEIGGTIESESSTYIAATFSSPLFGFMDDLEIKVDVNDDLIHFRSASRIGYGDMGVNAKRVEQLKLLYKKRLGEKF